MPGFCEADEVQFIVVDEFGDEEAFVVEGTSVEGGQSEGAGLGWLWMGARELAEVCGVVYSWSGWAGASVADDGGDGASRWGMVCYVVGAR